MPSVAERPRRRIFTIPRTIARIVKSKIFPGSPSNAGKLASVTVPSQISQSDRIQTAGRHIQTFGALDCRHVPGGRQPHLIHKLPKEILAHVFVLGAEEHTMLPVIVSHVCFAWRELALHTPSLWRRITLSPHELMWKERIRRTKSCPLDIQILPWITTDSGVPRSQHLDIHTVQWLMYLVTPYIHRWRSLEIIFTTFSPFLWNAALSNCCGVDGRVYAPLIQEVSLIYQLNDDTKSFTLFAGYAPRLRRLTLDGLRLTWLPSLFGNLTFLDYSHHRFSQGRRAIDEVLAMLEISSRLVQLRLLFPWYTRDIYTSHGPLHKHRRVTLPALTCLHVRVNGQDIPLEMIHLMNRISTPALSSLLLLDLDRSRTPFPRLYMFFEAFAIPSSLRTLRLEHGWCSPHVMSPFITLPYLRHVDVKCSASRSQRMKSSTHKRRKDTHSRVLSEW